MSMPPLNAQERLKSVYTLMQPCLQFMIGSGLLMSSGRFSFFASFARGKRMPIKKMKG